MAKFRYALDTIAPLWFKLVWANPNIQISSRIIQVNLLLGFKLKALIVEMKIKIDLIKYGLISLIPVSHVFQIQLMDLSRTIWSNYYY